jgi:uncharacterized protein (UPF0248 family)
MVYNILNRLKWTGKLRNCEVVILHRGAERDRKTIKGGCITEVKKGYFLYKNREETHIPMHRILEVRVKGEVVWKRKLKNR